MITTDPDPARRPCHPRMPGGTWELLPCRGDVLVAETKRPLGRQKIHTGKGETIPRRRGMIAAINLKFPRLRGDQGHPAARLRPRPCGRSRRTRIRRLSPRQARLRLRRANAEQGPQLPDQVTAPPPAQDPPHHPLARIGVIEPVVRDQQPRAGPLGDQRPADDRVEDAGRQLNRSSRGGSRMSTAQCTTPSNPGWGTGSVRNVNAWPITGLKSFGISQRASRAGSPVTTFVIMGPLSL